MDGAVAGASVIIAVDPHEHPLSKAQEFGATHTFNSSEPDLVDQIRAITKGGADYAFDTRVVGA
jgi:Zn-dependent alcohol dehydrogenase